MTENSGERCNVTADAQAKELGAVIIIYFIKIRQEGLIGPVKNAQDHVRISSLWTSEGKITRQPCQRIPRPERENVVY